MQQESPITLCHDGCWKDVAGGLDSSHINRLNLLSLRHAVRGQARPGRHLSLEGMGRPLACGHRNNGDDTVAQLPAALVCAIVGDHHSGPPLCLFAPCSEFQIQPHDGPSAKSHRVLCPLRPSAIASVTAAEQDG